MHDTVSVNILSFIFKQLAIVLPLWMWGLKEKYMNRQGITFLLTAANEQPVNISLSATFQVFLFRFELLWWPSRRQRDCSSHVVCREDNVSSYNLQLAMEEAV